MDLCVADLVEAASMGVTFAEIARGLAIPHAEQYRTGYRHVAVEEALRVAVNGEKALACVRLAKPSVERGP